MIKNYNASNIDELFEQGLIVSKRRESAVIVLNFPSFQIYHATSDEFHCGIAEPGLRLEKIIGQSYAYKDFLMVNMQGRIVPPPKAVRFTFSVNYLPQYILTSDHPKFKRMFDHTIPGSEINTDHEEGEDIFEESSRPEIIEEIELSSFSRIKSPFGKFVHWRTLFKVHISELNFQSYDLLSKIEQSLKYMADDLSKAMSLPIYEAVKNTSVKKRGRKK